MKISRQSLYDLSYKLLRILAPDIRNSQYYYSDALESYIAKDQYWLDLGCGQDLLPCWMDRSKEKQAIFANNCRILIGMDIDKEGLSKQEIIKHKVSGDAENAPFNDESFDIITANMVVEHLNNPGRILREVRRILKPSGVFICHTTNRFNYAYLVASIMPVAVKDFVMKILYGQKSGKRFPTNYRINSAGRAKRLFEGNGFGIVKLDMIQSEPVTMGLGPVAVFEMLAVKLLELNILSNLRSNIIVIAKKT